MIKTNNSVKNDKKTMTSGANCHLIAVKERGFINFIIEIDDDIKVRVRPILNNQKLNYKIYCRVNEEK